MNLNKNPHIGDFLLVNSISVSECIIILPRATYTNHLH